MDSLGLPMTFGNTFAPEVPVRPVPSAAIPSTRGSSSARGPRGAVGAGKRARGRGRGGAAEAYDVRRREKAKDGEALNSGVKRSDPPSPPQLESASHLPLRPPSQAPSAEVSSMPAPNLTGGFVFRGIDRGGRGGRGGRGSRGDGRGSRGDGRGRKGGRGGRYGTAEGGGGGGGGENRFFKESFCEDPWAGLMAERERRRGGAGTT